MWPPGRNHTGVVHKKPFTPVPCCPTVFYGEDTAITKEALWQMPLQQKQKKLYKASPPPKNIAKYNLAQAVCCLFRKNRVPKGMKDRVVINTKIEAFAFFYDVMSGYLTENEFRSVNRWDIQKGNDIWCTQKKGGLLKYS